MITLEELSDLIFSGTEDESYLEEIANSASHLLGIIISIVGLYFLVLVATSHKSSWHHSSSCIVYGLSLFTLYLCSTIHHSAVFLFEDDVHLREHLRNLDYTAIYILIAGSYTPTALVVLVKRGGHTILGYFILIFVWTCAIVGSVAKMVFAPPLYFSVIAYLSLGWFAVIASGPIIRWTPPRSLYFLKVGGATYSLGVIFLLWHALQFNHSIWHLHVLLGSMFHYLCALICLLPNIDNDDPHQSTFQLLHHFFFAKTKVM